MDVFIKLKTHLGVVGRLFDDLGRHPERRADEGVALDLRVRQLSRHAEVGQLHLALLGQQHVGGCRRGEEELWSKEAFAQSNTSYARCLRELPLPPSQTPPSYL